MAGNGLSSARARGALWRIPCGALRAAGDVAAAPGKGSAARPPLLHAPEAPGEEGCDLLPGKRSVGSGGAPAGAGRYGAL